MGWEGIEHPITTESVRFAPGEHAKYVPNNRSFGAFIRSDQVRDAVVEVAKEIAALAKELSPKSDAPGKHMANSFTVQKNAGLIKVSGNLRVRVLVNNNDRAAALNEFGTKRNKRVRMLGRAGAAFGDFKPDGGPT